MVSDELLRQQLGRTLGGTKFPELGVPKRGKVRDIYEKDDELIIVTTDRLSAFDVVLCPIPWKGQVLNELAAQWFAGTRHIAPNHLVGMPDPNVMRVRKCRVIPIEMIMRGYLTGVTSTSIWTGYQAGRREFGGCTLPDGMRKNEPLPRKLLTPTTKAAEGSHDLNVTPDEIIARGIVDRATWKALADMCEAMFAFGQETARERGLILVDTKYELGIDPDGTIVFVDEIHTPDSSRYWYASDYKERLARGEEPRSLDKEFVRRWYVDHGYKGEGVPPVIPDEIRLEAARRYIAAYEMVTGETFVPDTEEPESRIRRNLGL
jgi:phosphoribosylaminoimidazole-succinocarboxamide synthase